MNVQTIGLRSPKLPQYIRIIAAHEKKCKNLAAISLRTSKNLKEFE